MSDDSSTGRIGAGEAAARLGIKRETLYAYVSRGLLSSRPGASPRESAFDAAEVSALAARRGGRKPGRSEIGIASTVTEIRDQRIRYRGHALERLIAEGLPFERVAELLWDASAPLSWEPDAQARRAARAAIKAMPASMPLLDRFRIAAVAASATDPLRHDARREAVGRAGARLIALLVDAAGDGAKGEGTIADRLWSRLAPASAKRPKNHVAALNAALVLLADHDLAASTFAVRIAASVRADPYSAVAAGLGALGGPLHGMASRGARALLAAARDAGAARAVGDALRDGRELPGFHHPLYADGDPRASLLLTRILELGIPRTLVRAIIDVRGLVHERTDRHPNIDFALAALAEATALRADAGEAIFAIARSAGWLAHALDEYAEPQLAFRYRPVARYVGPESAGTLAGKRRKQP